MMNLVAKIRGGEKFMRHEMKIVVARPNEEPISVAKFGKLFSAGKLFGRWFGKVQKVMVIVPEDSVEKIEIKEVKSKNANQSKTL